MKQTETLKRKERFYLISFHFVIILFYFYLLFIFYVDLP